MLSDNRRKGEGDGTITQTPQYFVIVFTYYLPLGQSIFELS